MKRFGDLLVLFFFWIVPVCHPLLAQSPVLQLFQQEAAVLEKQITALKSQENITAENKDRLADAEIFLKGVQWAIRYEPKLEANDLALIKKSLSRCAERLSAITSNKPIWTRKHGKLVRGYYSAVDDSVQPFGLIIPKNYEPAKPIRLDVVLHGSSKPVGLSELRFMARFEEGDEATNNAPEVNYIELHPLGRVENCYRWAGETDVFEAIEAVARQYLIDRDRIVLRGMSMGASGTWHLGLKHPDRFVALGPYCGYVDTFEFSRTPIPNFVKVGPLPSHQEKALHMLDSIDYAANAGVVPSIACMGEKDVFFQAHVLMEKAMTKEGLKMVNLISPGTGHVIDPVTHAEQMKQINEFALKGIDHVPNKIRFVTWTLKYSRCHWIQILGLEEHYRRAEIEASFTDDVIDVKESKNITKFAIQISELPKDIKRLRVNGQDLAIPPASRIITIEKTSGKWETAKEETAKTHFSKLPGLQGPIDDAFTTPFLCVRGTGTAWNPKIQVWSAANLKRFEYEWNRYFRGALRIKDDKDVSEADIRKFNLILFGDPGSNSLISKALPKMPLRWTKDQLTMGDKTYSSMEHAPCCVYPNPLNNSKYVVLNSGHSFHEQELNLFNYLLFPRLGDWAVMKIGQKHSDSSGGNFIDEAVIQAGFFDESWQFAK